MELLFCLCQLTHFVAVTNNDICSRPAVSSCSSRAVNKEIYVGRHIHLDNVSYVRNIQTSGSQVASNENGTASPSELIQSLLSLIQLEQRLKRSFLKQELMELAMALMSLRTILERRVTPSGTKS